MESPLHSFEPSLYGINTLTIVFLSLTFLLAVLLYFQNKRKVPYYEKKRKRLYSMLLFFGILIFGTTGLLNFVNSLNLKTVKFYSNLIETPQGRISYDDIQSAYIYVDKPFTLTQTPDQPTATKNRRLLIIEEYNKKTHVLSEENYQLEEILTTLKKFAKKE